MQSSHSKSFIENEIISYTSQKKFRKKKKNSLFWRRTVF